MTVTVDSFCSSFCHQNKTKHPSCIFLRNVLWQINPNFTNARDECYDTAATMPWKKYSVKTQIILIATEAGIICKFLKKSTLTKYSYETCAFKRKKWIKEDSQVLSNTLHDKSWIMLFCLPWPWQTKGFLGMVKDQDWRDRDVDESWKILGTTDNI